MYRNKLFLPFMAMLLISEKYFKAYFKRDDSSENMSRFKE